MQLLKARSPEWAGNVLTNYIAAENDTQHSLCWFPAPGIEEWHVPTARNRMRDAHETQINSGIKRSNVMNAPISLLDHSLLPACASGPYNYLSAVSILCVSLDRQQVYVSGLRFLSLHFIHMFHQTLNRVCRSLGIVIKQPCNYEWTENIAVQSCLFSAGVADTVVMDGISREVCVNWCVLYRSECVSATFTKKLEFHRNPISRSVYECWANWQRGKREIVSKTDERRSG